MTELYTKAVEQLGRDKAALRLGGLYALERLAQDSPGHRQIIVNVICAYLRMPYTPPEPAPAPDPEGDRKATLRAARRPGETPDGAENLSGQPGQPGCLRVAPTTVPPFLHPAVLLATSPLVARSRERVFLPRYRKSVVATIDI
ncbi:hypothetical protein [Streptosporangium sandarakinum]|uniref:hypothetical protein n=1 Tax=Streptosporangium sandarakinum TaxID=1260955 RepID=UPI0034213586